MRRTTRTKLYRFTMYAIFIAIVVWVALATDWVKITTVFFNVEVAIKQFPNIIVIALRNTILFTLIAFVGGAILGVLFAIMKLSSVGPYRWFATAWIELFRGMPAILTLFIIAYGLPIGLGFQMPGGAIVSGLLGLIMVSSAYIAEVVRSGIQAVPKGQTEASRSLGMSPMKTMFWVVLPQGFRIIIPPMTNEFVLLLKDTSLLFVVGSTLATKELTTFARDAQSVDANSTPLIMAALLYLVVTIPLTRAVAWLERKMAKQR
ncbi:amino acid ABC transporter permease [Microbacterium sp. TWP3-1-2b2]|uniref:amino acid ABC transporter permease n=1 Tax=Microbacterium sp. TWP3-1-2b2 TaxID=2804651 RepID=UPI003CEA33EE